MAEEVKKTKRGGARPNAGRKSKLDEEKTKKLALNAIIKEFGSEEAAWQDMAKKAKEGSYKHNEFLFSYAYGKPKENVDITTQGEAMNIISLGEGKKPNEPTS